MSTTGVRRGPSGRPDRAKFGGGLSGFLSAAIGQDPSVYQPLEQSFLEILETSEIVRFDASDLMPADVGAGTFWSEGTSP
jgi:alpha-glucoside transport system substrate-binding protein